MNFKILEYIVAIAETGNVTKAAERLFISQSGLNQQLIKLETELGTPLFHRSKKKCARLMPGVFISKTQDEF